MFSSYLKDNDDEKALKRQKYDTNDLDLNVKEVKIMEEMKIMIFLILVNFFLKIMIILVFEF